MFARLNDDRESLADNFEGTEVLDGGKEPLDEALNASETPEAPVTLEAEEPLEASDALEIPEAIEPPEAWISPEVLEVPEILEALETSEAAPEWTDDDGKEVFEVLYVAVDDGTGVEDLAGDDTDFLDVTAEVTEDVLPK